MKQRMYINGAWVEAQAKATRAIFNPANGATIAEVPEADREDARLAIAAAREAFDNGPWPHLPASQRGELVYKLGVLIEENAEELARLESLDTGKTVEESRWDMADIAGIFKYYGGLADKMGGEVIDAPTETATSVVVREPVGVCGQISPWNYPLLQAAWKMAPALAAGCTLIMKPSEITPMTAIRVTELAESLDFPPGVINLLLGPGDPVGAELSESPLVDLISFTGGIATGKKIMCAASGNVKKVALELGGKNPNIIFADADFDVALDYVLNGVFFHAGQICSAGARVMVERPLHDRLVAELRKRMAAIKVGDGFAEGTEMGPLISQAHRDKVERYVVIAQEEGAKLVLGGKRPDDPALQNGFFYLPTLFDQCENDMRIVQEEVFGPVITIETFDTEEEALERANSTIYGLSAGFWTGDQARIKRMTRGLRFGTVWVNDFNVYFTQAPWGGYKQSGLGRELGMSGLEEYTEQKHIYHNHQPQPLHWFGRS
ncbi:aldehyde dehydrogenase family protein [Desulfobulbus rhabdoformis]|uniref:aldehyde dehydrogenase family protein n=1 Tax=Desulfobulbus rhabdoformis TaxID=34032 RepID=UPI0019657B5D|nr:aldehyde dehydrogenase family protein [Desulfobulbus rhabdoformis]MBM9615097.1 aldehyde dehydrogenase family protein [Desulfobulbus rhabdoformis]